MANGCLYAYIYIFTSSILKYRFLKTEEIKMGGGGDPKFLCLLSDNSYNRRRRSIPIKLDESSICQLQGVYFYYPARDNFACGFPNFEDPDRRTLI